MKAADIHPLEEKRLEELIGLQLLDTDPEIEYDEITLLVSQICETPIALISLIDETRQWFKSKQGLMVDETPREFAFCAHTILQNDVLVVPDATQDERFKDNPLVSGDPHVVFYAGAPLLSPGGYPVGTLCVIDHKPRNLSEAQAKGMMALSHQLSRLLRLKMQISIEKELKEQIAVSSKMSALGEMASGVAHEINTPLAVIIGKSNALIEKLKKAPLSSADLTMELEKLKSTADRIAKIVLGLRLFSRNSKNDKMEVVSVSEIIDSTLELCRERIHHGEIKLSIHIQNDALVLCRPTELSQVMMNLFSNSMGAVESFSVRWIRVQVSEADGTLSISVTDSGPGIPPDIASRMMEPFFTTKEFDKGTGLGLSISTGIVKEHGGKLYYDKDCKNTRFVIELPAQEKRA